MKEIIFIYNAQSGLTQGAIDWAHKLVSPQTYNCSLCNLTYGNLGKYDQWSKFLKSLNLEKTFIYQDQLNDLKFYNQESLPCIFFQNENQYSQLITSEQLNLCSNLENLIKLIENKISLFKSS